MSSKQSGICGMLPVCNKSKPTEEQEFIGILRTDPQMKAAFLNKVAPPIASKMFDCGMIP